VPHPLGSVGGRLVVKGASCWQGKVYNPQKTLQNVIIVHAKREGGGSWFFSWRKGCVCAADFFSSSWVVCCAA